MAPAARIFVSRAHEDTAWCRAFVQALREAGADLWYDEHDLGDGVMGEEIERELQARPIFIVILSPASLASPGAQREVSAAMGLREKDCPNTRSMLLVMAEQVDVPRLWADYQRVSGPGDRGLSATVAARRVISTLAIAPAHTLGASLVSARSEPGREVKAYRLGPHALHRVTRWVNIAALVVMTACILALLLYLLTPAPPPIFPGDAQLSPHRWQPF
jgi:TIR domain